MAETSRISQTVQDDILIVEILDKQITEYNQSQEVRQQLVGAINAAPSNKVLIDMKNVEYLTSVALFIFVDARSATEAKNGRAVICNLSDVVVKVLTVTQLIVESRSHANYLEMAADRQSALELLSE